MDIFLADESVDHRIIAALRDRGFFVVSIIDLQQGWSDEQVLAYCVENDYILITEDKDFGELTNRLKISNKGIILLRLTGINLLDKNKLVINTYVENYLEFKNAFSVLNAKKLRIRKYKNTDII